MSRNDTFSQAQLDQPLAFDGAQLAPTLVKLGLAIGILRPAADGSPDSYELNAAWFQNPLGETGRQLSANGAQIAALFSALLGEVSASALGLPAQDLGTMGVWYPIPNPATGRATGFYLVNYPRDASAPDGEQVFGIGVLHQWHFSAQGVSDAASDIDVRIWGLLPIVSVGQGGMQLALDQADSPLNMGVQFAAADGASIIDTNGFSFNGVKLSAQLDLLGSPAVDLSVVILQLQLPTESAPVDRNLSQLAQVTPQAWLSTVATLFVSALQQVLGQDARASNLLPIFGLSPIVPDCAVRLPLLGWEQLLSQANAGSPLYAPFVSWFNQLLAQPGAFGAWMGAIGALLGTPAAGASGSGTAADPYLTALLSETGYGALSLTMVTQVDQAGVRYLLPGLRFEGDGKQLGSAAAQVLVRAQLDLAQFSLATSGRAGISTRLLNLNMGIVLASTVAGSPLFDGEVGGARYVFGSVGAGLSVFQSDTLALKVVPAFRLQDVSTPTGQYATIDLTQPGQLVDQALGELYALVDAAFAAVFGLDQAAGSGRQAAMLLGVLAPEVDAPLSWPAALPPPFSASQLVTTFQNPVAALANYYRALVQPANVVGDRLAIYYLLRAAARLFDSGAAPADARGSGAAADPWLFGLGSDSLPASLLAYVETGAGAASSLTLGLRLAPQVSFGDAVTLDIGIDVHALTLQLPASATDTALQACIFPGIAATLALPQSFTTPPVAGAAVAIDGASFTGGWSRRQGWRWNMAVGQPAVIVDGTRMPVGVSMVFSDSDTLDQLVGKEAATFAPIVVALAGVAVYRTGNRPGLALNAILGLLPQLAPFVPAGLAWPAQMPVLQPQGFADPLGDLRRQLSALLSDGRYATAALALLGWSLDGQAAAPAVTGEGTETAPWAVPVALPGQFELAVWSAGAAPAPRLGLGLQRSVAWHAAAIAARTQVLLRCVELALDGAVPAVAALPSFRVQTVLTPDTPLPIVAGAADYGELLSLQLGLEVRSDGGQLTLQPQVLMTMRAGGAVQTYDLQQLQGQSSQWLASFYAILNVGVDQLLTPLLANGAVNNAYQLLALMNLTVPLGAGNTRAAIDAAGWTAMLAAPLDFFRARGIALFADAGTRPRAVALLQALTGIGLPPLPLPLLQIFNALGLVEDEQHGFAPRLHDWLDLLSHPARQLRQRFAALTGDAVRLSALVDQLSLQLEPVTVGPLRLTVSQGAVFHLGLVEPVKPGGVLRLQGELTADLRSHQLAANLSLYCAAVRLDVRAALLVDGAAPAALKVVLGWGDGSEPMPEALTLYPFDAATFLRQVTVLAPPFALATFFTQVVDARLLNRYQLARTAMSALGLAFQDPATRLWHTKSPLGLFDDPLGWLLGDAVLGANGQLNIATLATVLSTVTGTSKAANGIGVMPVAGGIRIFGLPYRQQIDLVADVAAQTFSVVPGLPADTSLPLADGVALDAFRFSLTLGANFQPGLAGAVALSGKLGDTATLLLNAGYDKGFLLSAGQRESGQTFQVLPFPGWQTLVLQAVRQSAQALLTSLTTVLLDQLAQAGAEQFVASLRYAGGTLQVRQLVASLIASTDRGADAVAQAALDWLAGRLSQANAPATVDAAVALLSPYFSGIAADAGLLKYTPSAALPVTLVSGLQTLSGVAQVGLWIELALPASDSLVLAIAPTGIGIAVNHDGTLAPGHAPQFNFQLSVLAPLQDDCGPQLTLAFSVADGGFILGVDPAGSVAARSSYYRELLPTLFGVGNRDDRSKELRSWLESILLNLVPRYVSVVLLNQAGVRQWLEQPLFANGAGPSAAAVLMASQLVIESKSLYMLNSMDALQALTLETFLAGFLRALLAREFQLLGIGKSGGIWLGPRAGKADYFGLRVMVPDMALAAVPYVTFQLGDEKTAWIEHAGGDVTLQGGVSAYVPISATAPDFGGLLLELVNIGFDFHGKDQQNLVQLQRFSMKAVQPRGLLTVDFGEDQPVQSFGGGVELSGIALSLAPNAAVSGGKVNPVAQNLLGSGDAGSPQRDNAATNPAFSVRASYVERLYVELFNGEDDSLSELWFDVQRSFGPLYASKVGIGWQQSDYRLGVLFDGSVSLAGLYIGLDTLSIGVPVTTPLDYSAYALDLAGIDVRFSGGAVEIAGGFLKQDKPLQYSGSATVKMGKFGLMALGAYALVPVDPARPDGDTAASLFIFANLNFPLGPDPAFFINGIAAGFAYNRNLKLPEPGEIHRFPLVQGAVDPATFGGDDPANALAVLSQVVYPEIGQYWVAGGIAFSTYQLLNSFALLIVRFGREFAIDLIGISAASFPPNAKPDKALAYVELGLMVSFHPAQGVVSVRAQLTPNSFVLSRDCKLTGGFAATLWYQGEHAGDFVITLGGYNPAFKVPAHYPVVPRLGFNWPMDIGIGSLNISGGAYFALTPSAIMAGGYLNVLFKTGPLRAWFSAGVDFLIQWQPFYFLMNGHVSVGAGFETEIAGVKLSLTAQIGARLILWGPPIAGEVGVDWYVISFTIPFGDTGQQQPATRPLDWDAFQQAFLPPLDSDHGGTGMRAAAPVRSHRLLRELAAQAPTPPAPLAQAYAVLKMQVGQGLIEDYPGLGWIIQSPFALSVATVIPATSIAFAGAPASLAAAAPIGIAPMAQPSVSSPLLVTMLGWDTASGRWTPVDLVARKIACSLTRNGAPEALWSRQAFDPNGVPQAKIIPDSLMGAVLEGTQVLLYAGVGPIDLAALRYETLGPLPLPFAWTPHYPPQPPGDQRHRAQVIASTLMDTLTVVPLRSAIYAALRELGQPAMDAPDLSVLQNNVMNLFQSAPSLASLGMDLLPSAPPAAVQLALRTAAAGASAAMAAPTATRVIGTSRSYRSRQLRQGPGKLAHGVPLARARLRSTWVDGPPAGMVAVAGEAAASVSLRLTPGTTSIIRLGSEAPRQLRVSGALPLRVCAFNEYQEPLRQGLADAGTGLHALPAATHEVVAIAGQDEQAPVAGWDRDSQWTRLNHYYFHGEGCLVRPEAAPVVPRRLNSRLRPRKRGQFDCSDVMDSNQVSNAAGGVSPGWVETLFFAPAATIAVLVAGDTPPAVQLCHTTELALAPYGAPAAPLRVQAQALGASLVCLYAVPQQAADGEQLAVLVRPAPDAALQGVLAVAHAVHEVGELAGAMQCRAAPPARAAAVPPSCLVELA